MSSSWNLLLIQDNSRSFCTFIVSNHTLNNADKRSLLFNCMPPPSPVSIHCNGFFSLFSYLSPFFVIFHLAFPCFCRTISLFILWWSFFILVPRAPSLLWVFSFHPFSFPPLPFSCCCECHILKRLVDSTPPGYKHCLTHLCQSLFFLVLSFFSLSSSPFLDSPLSLTSLFFYSGSAGPQWAIIGAVEGSIVVLAIVVVVVPWSVHKRRKRRKAITSEYQTLLASHQSHESWQQSCLRWPTYKCVV